MKVAFCSNNGVSVNEHFGRSRYIYIYDVDEDGYTLSEKRELIVVDGSKEHKDTTESKVRSIKDCALLYVCAIGGPAAAVSVRNKIHPIKVDENTDIVNLLERLKNLLRANPPIWLKKVIQTKGE
ncbi:MAG: nitrogen fixation protein NifX [Deferribacterota bacterium]|nr:nitrogen fixation protein NifX [Deferribacterota bacterium]